MLLQVLPCLLMAQLRSAHLPSKEFREPFHPVADTTPLPAADWVTVQDEDSSYSVLMPYAPMDMELGMAGIKGRICFDVAAQQAYFVAALASTGVETSVLADSIRERIRVNGSLVQNGTPYTASGMRGTELIAEQKNQFFRIIILSGQGRVYLLMVTAQEQALLRAGNAERFLASFVPHQPLRRASLDSWPVFTDTLRAFRAAFPKPPSLNALGGMEDTEDFTHTSYSCVDPALSGYCIVFISETRPGYLITADSMVFNNKLDYYRDQDIPVTDLRYFTWQGCKAMSFRALIRSADEVTVSHLRVLIRQNRAYTLAVVTPGQHAEDPAIDNFFNSFQLLPWHSSGWSTQTAPCGRFSTWSPSGIRLQPADSALQELAVADRDCDYLAFDSGAAVTFNVEVGPLPRYAYAENDSAYFAALCAEYYTDTASEAARNAPGQFDSLLLMRPVVNGALQGYELMVKNAAKPFFKRVRLLRHGNYPYRIYAMGDSSYLTGPEVNRFFEDFRVAGAPQPTTLFTRKTDLIVDGLLSNDSALRTGAENAFRELSLLPADFPLLWQGLLRAADSASDRVYTAAERLAFGLEQLDSSSVQKLTAQAYEALPAASAKKMLLLQVLASNRNAGAAAMVKELLLQSPPRTGSPTRLYFWLGDSLELCANILPQLTSLYSDSLLGPGLIYLTVRLTDSGCLHRSFLKAHASALLEAATRRLAYLQTHTGGYPLYTDDLVRALGLLGGPAAISRLRQFQELQDPELNLLATLELLKMRQPVAPAMIWKTAALPDYRIWMYEEMKKAALLRYFPAEFRQQPRFAETYIVRHAASEDNVSMEEARFSLLGERSAVISGQARRFYIFRVHFAYGEDQSTCIAVCGGFEPDRRIPDLRDETYATAIYYEDPLPVDLDAIFRRFSEDVLTGR